MAVIKEDGAQDLHRSKVRVMARVNAMGVIGVLMVSLIAIVYIFVKPIKENQNFHKAAVSLLMEEALVALEPIKAEEVFRGICSMNVNGVLRRDKMFILRLIIKINFVDRRLVKGNLKL